MTRESSESQRRRKPRRRYAAPKQGGSVMPWIFGGGVVALCLLAFAMPREAAERRKAPTKAEPPRAQSRSPDVAPKMAPGPSSPDSRADIDPTIQRLVNAASDEAAFEKMVTAEAQSRLDDQVRRNAAIGLRFEGEMLAALAREKRAEAERVLRLLTKAAAAGRQAGLSDASVIQLFEEMDRRAPPTAIQPHQIDSFIRASIEMQKRVDAEVEKATRATRKIFGDKEKDQPSSNSVATKRLAFIETILSCESNEKARAGLEELVAQKLIEKALDEGAAGKDLSGGFDKFAATHRAIAKRCVSAMIVIAKSGRRNGLSDEVTSEVVKLIDQGAIPIDADDDTRDSVIESHILQRKAIETGD